MLNLIDMFFLFSLVWFGLSCHEGAGKYSFQIGLLMVALSFVLRILYGI